MIERDRVRDALPLLLVLTLAVAASASGLGNGFAYDDVPIIRDNARVHDLTVAWRLFGQPYWPPPWTGEVYRPLTLLLFTAQWSLGGGSPLLFHIVSIALYAGVCIAVHRLAVLVLPDAPRAALAAAVLFAVHPVHVESVGNIVGQAELLVALFVTSAVALYVRWRRADSTIPLGAGRIAALAALFLGACLAKEHGIVLPALLVLAELLLVPHATLVPAARRARLLAPTALVLLAVAVGFLVVRTVVVGGVGGATSPAFIGHSLEARLLTAVGAVPHWIRLLLWPAALSADYLPQHVPLRTSLGVEALGAIVLLLSVPVLALLMARRQPVVAYALGFVVVAILPVSNLLVQTGIIVAERTLFLASIGAMLLVGAGVAAALRHAGSRGRSALAVALAALVVLGAWRSAVRQPVWRDSATVFEQTVRDAPLSYKAHWMWGMTRIEAGDTTSGLRELRAAAHLYPHDGLLQRTLGEQLRAAGHCPAAFEPLERALELRSDESEIHALIADCNLRVARFTEAARAAKRGLAITPRDPALLMLARVADSVLVARDSAPAGAVPIPPVTPRTAMRPLAARPSRDR
ncbi:MAG TPA: hypothetical protein VFZ11_06370 [Gemmatimonadaceae bacterium]